MRQFFKKKDYRKMKKFIYSNLESVYYDKDTGILYIRGRDISNNLKSVKIKLDPEYVSLLHQFLEENINDIDINFIKAKMFHK